MCAPWSFNVCTLHMRQNACEPLFQENVAFRGYGWTRESRPFPIPTHRESNSNDFVQRCCFCTRRKRYGSHFMPKRPQALLSLEHAKIRTSKGHQDMSLCTCILTAKAAKPPSYPAPNQRFLSVFRNPKPKTTSQSKLRKHQTGTR